jgi:hypothetical protein
MAGEDTGRNLAGEAAEFSTWQKESRAANTQMIPFFHKHTNTSSLSIFLVNILMRWHEWLFQPSVSPAATSSTGVPRWPATSHTTPAHLFNTAPRSSFLG